MVGFKVTDHSDVWIATNMHEAYLSHHACLTMLKSVNIKISFRVTLYSERLNATIYIYMQYNDTHHVTNCND